MPNQQVIGIQRVLENQKGHSWNNRKLRWTIVHNSNNESKPYDIELEIVLISSKRILKVNNEVKDVKMCSFGYQVNFDINQKLKGYVKQDSLSFELFVNGKSFTSLQQTNNEMYPLTSEPPKLEIQNQNPWVSKKIAKQQNFFSPTPSVKQSTKHIQKPFISSPISKPSITKTKSIEFQDKLNSPQFQRMKIKQFSLIQTKQQKKEVQNTIKDTQSQLMRILMQEKKKKKLQQEVNIN